MATLTKATGKGRGLVLTGLGVSLALGLVVVAALTFMLSGGAPTSKAGPVPIPVAQSSQPAATVPTTTTTASVPASSPTATVTVTTSLVSSASPITSVILPANSIDPANIISPTATPVSYSDTTAQAATASSNTPAPPAADATTTPSQQSQPPSQGDTGALSAGTGTGQANPLSAAVPPALPLVLANPVKLSIPAISLVDKQVKLVEPETVRLRDGSTVRQWAVPDAAVGVHDSKTGQVCKWGLTALVAHNYWPAAYQPALFVNLGKLKPGDSIEVTDDGGTSCSYTVEENRVVNLTEGGKLLSEQGKIADLTRNHLLLYTCTPQFNDNRQMVTAVQVIPPKP